MPFSPGRTIALDVDGTSGSATISADAPQVLVTNAGPGMVFLVFGTGVQTASEEDMPVLPGHQLVLTKGVGANTVAAVTEGEAARLFVTVGTGT